MGRRKKRYKKRRPYKRSRAPGWYKQRSAKRYAARVTVLSLLALLFLTVIVPCIFAVAGGYDELVADTQVWETLVEDDFDKSGHDDWGILSKHGYTCVQTGDTGWLHSNGDVFWTYPDEQGENYTTGVLDITGCSETDGKTIGLWFYLNVEPADLLSDNADQLKLRFRASIGVGEFEIQSEAPTDAVADGGYWSYITAGGIEPEFLTDDHYKYNYSESKWLELTYKWSRASLIQADQVIESAASGRFTFMLNLTDASYSPMDWDGELVDVWFGFFSEGGGYSLWGDVFGWSLGLVMIVMAAASTPYWNPMRDVGRSKRYWRSQKRRRR